MVVKNIRLACITLNHDKMEVWSLDSGRARCDEEGELGKGGFTSRSNRCSPAVTHAMATDQLHEFYFLLLLHPLPHLQLSPL